MSRAARSAALAVLLATPLAAQSGGAIAGRVRDFASERPLDGVLISVDGGLRGAVTDAAGAYRVREVASGWHRVRAARIGYVTAVRESVLVRSGETVTADFALQAQAVAVGPVSVEAPAHDVVLDPLATATTQRISGAELRRLPVSTVEEGIALSAGAVGESYRGGRLGEQSFILDGLGLKNQLDASTGPLGVRVPPDMLEEAALVTDGFSARYGQAISGLVNVVTKDGGDHWGGRVAHETDRPLPDGWDYGLDRFVAEGEGPVGRARMAAALDATARLDADPVDAPRPADPLDPRAAEPWVLPHNSGETYDAAAKLTLPLGARETVRLFAARSLEQRLLYDPAFKYDERFAPARRVAGTLLAGHWQHVSGPRTARPVVLDLHVSYFTRDFLRGTLVAPVPYRYGAFTGRTFHVVGEDLARAQDTAAGRAAVPGLTAPDFAANTPWGVPAFFLDGGSRGEVAWNNFRELRGQLDVDVGLGPSTDLLVGGALVGQRVRTFSRVLGYLPVGDTVPPAVAADFSPLTAAAYVETQYRWSDLGFTLGLRYDQFDPRAVIQAGRLGARRSLSPRFAVSTVLQNATFVASWGRFSQAPDFQYLVDAAFDDTSRTGRFRRGNPDLGFESATQYQFSVRVRPSPRTSLRVNAYVKRLDGLVASVPLGVDPDSTIFGNTDFGTVKGVEVLAERELRDWWGVRVSYTLQQATATATNAFQILRRIQIDSVTGDTINPARVEFPLDYDRRHSVTLVLQGRVPDAVRLPGAAALRGLEGAAVVRYASGLPYSRTTPTGDTLLGLPNSWRLPPQSTVDVLVRRPLRVLGRSGGLYLDVRNLLGRRNVVAVRRDTGDPTISPTTLQAMAQSAYAAHPEPIPYESPRYRPWADTDHDGYVDGPGELLPLYLAAAQDYTQPIFDYGPPRLARLGVELVF